MAIYKAIRSSAPIVLASATPSLETFHNMKIGKYIHLTLPKRATGAALPDIKLIDLKVNTPERGRWISSVLINEIKSLGSFKVVLNLHPEVQTEISINVLPEDNK